LRRLDDISLTARLTLLFAVASGAVLLVLGLVIGGLVQQHFEELDRATLSGKLELARHAIARIRSGDELERLEKTLDDALVGHHGLEVLVLGPARETLLATPGARFPAALLEAREDGAEAQLLTWQDGEIAYRGLSAAIATGVPDWPPLRVAVATDISRHHAFMRSFLKILWLFVAVAAAATGFLGWVAARRGLAPLSAMRARAAAVTARHLNYRLPVDAVPPELAELARTLNEMLARLEEAFQRLSNFSSDLAHELRTPVSNLMTQTQVALSRARSAEDYRAVLESNAEEYERLAKMIGDMLFLAKAEHGLVIPAPETVDLAREVRELFEFYDALADEKRVRLALEGEGRVEGDRLMLRRALSNLLSNAIRHAPADGSVTVRIGSDDGSTRISVENDGETIPGEHVERLFDRFYRADPSRQRSGEGAGLGLAITRSIVAAHRGTVSVTSMDGLTRFTLGFPAA